jgi:hypothetical protein
MLEKTHRRAVEDVMQSDDISDVERVARVLAMEAEYLGLVERLRAATPSLPVPELDERGQGRR